MPAAGGQRARLTAMAIEPGPRRSRRAFRLLRGIAAWGDVEGDRGSQVDDDHWPAGPPDAVHRNGGQQTVDANHLWCIDMHVERKVGMCDLNNGSDIDWKQNFAQPFRE